MTPAGREINLMYKNIAVLVVAMLVFGVPAWAQDAPPKLTIPDAQLAPIYKQQRDDAVAHDQNATAAAQALANMLVEAQATVAAVSRDLTGIEMPDDAAEAGP